MVFGKFSILLLHLILNGIFGLSDGCLAHPYSYVSNRFSVKLYDKLGTSQSSSNVFFSPLSISAALGMLELGARGNTKTQIDIALETENAVDIHENISRVLEDTNNSNNNFTLQIVNRLFGEQGFSFNSTYLADSTTFYGEPLERHDFANSPEESRVEINKWIKERTEDTIKDIFQPGDITDSSILALVSAVYFKGNWASPFDKRQTRKRPFYTANPRPTLVDMMTQTGRFRYAHSETWQASMIEIPYYGTASMLIILPDQRDGLGYFESEFTIDEFDRLRRSMQGTRVSLSLPGFVLENMRIDLKEPLKSLGMTDLFSSNADLSGIGGTPGELQLSKLVYLLSGHHSGMVYRIYPLKPHDSME